MKAEKEATWKGEIVQTYERGTKEFQWGISTSDDIGIEYPRKWSVNFFETRQQAIANFKEYAELNGITKYKFKEV